MFGRSWRSVVLASGTAILVAGILNEIRAMGAEANPRYEGLGSHTRKITTDSATAQAEFNVGLAFLYGFNHDEAIRAFERALAADPECAPAHWAIALANGPNINYPLVDPDSAAAAWKSLSAARRFLASASPVEQSLIEALSKRYHDPPPEDRRPLDVAYAAAMRRVWEQFPDDADVGALFAESLMDLWPWDLWSADGQPRDDTAEVLTTLERVLALSPNHPLALHLYIHALEASPSPDRAAGAADRLRNLQPGLGHMVHMPSHIDVRLGRWQQAIAANEKAIVADARYRALSPDQDFYRLYMAHNHHMLAFAAMMQGQQARSTAAIRQMLDEIPEDWLQKNALFADGMFAMPYELHIRFGRWDEMLAEAEPRAILPIARTLRRYARGVAFAAKHHLAEARAEQKRFLAAKAELPPEAMFVQNRAADVLAIAEKMLDGEILYRDGQVAEGIAALQEAVAREDRLRYIEPPDWIQPVRHVLGATLMDAGRFADAEAVFREDLKRHPHNGWSLHDLARSLQKQGKLAESRTVQAEFEVAWRHADVKLSSACYCLPGKP
ncbi:MAG: hypothetical protein SFV23_13165 [Planctomycetaceae bacterium]|nr:hypothetical protein [Planctomycetaceae bacterium]